MSQQSPTRLFLDAARRDFLTTGAIAPSSRFLARSAANAIPASSAPLTVMEVGAGTGALTAEIVERLPAGSILDIYEMNPVFARHLAMRFGNGDIDREPRDGARTMVRSAWKGINVRVNNRCVTEIPEGPRYDAIVSGLPLNNFEPALVRRILERLLDSLKPGGVLTYFEYLLIRQLKSLTTGKEGRRRLRRIGRVTGGFLQKYEFHRDAILLNIPPAVVHHLRKPAG